MKLTPRTRTLLREPRTTDHDEITIHGRRVTKGTELSFTGLRGRFTFRAHVTLPDGREWLDVYDREGRLRALRIERVKTVHRIARRRLSEPMNEAEDAIAKAHAATHRKPRR